MSPRICRRPLAAALALLALLAIPAGAAAQNAALVKDITPPGHTAPPGNLRAADFLAAGGKLFFADGDSSIWSTDGTAAGTELLGAGCARCGSPQLLAAARGLAFWSAQSDDGPLLVRSDGTRAGTYALRGPEGDLSLARDDFDVYGPRFAVLGDVLYFAGCRTAGSGCFNADDRLWRTDGTAAGTRPVQAAGERDFIDELTVWKGKLFYFSFQSGPPALWTSDGTDAGTREVRELSSGPDAQPRRLTALADRLVFIAAVGDGDELWASDGTTAGTLAITAFAPHTPFDVPDGDQTPPLRVLGGRAYFVADDVVHGAEIWTSDGTAAGTRRVTDFGYYAPFARDRELQAGLLGSRLVFVASDGLSPAKLWKTDGAPETTAALGGEPPDEDSDLVPIGGRLVVSGANGTEISATDGTAAGTRTLCPGSCGSAVSPPQAVGGRVLFFASDNSGKGDLWTTDGMPAGTRRFTRLGTVAGGSPLASLGGRVFFDAAAGHGIALWKSDGTAAGTRPVAESWDGPSSSLAGLADRGGRLLFTSCDFFAGWAGWTSEGSAATTQPFTASTTGSCYSLPQLLGIAGGIAFYRDFGFWSTDSTSAGTVRLDLGDWAPTGSAAVLGHRLFFQATRFSDPSTAAIWGSDGTPQGTAKAFDLPAGLAQLRHLAAAGGKLYLDGSTADGISRSVWSSDGTPAGTVKIADVGVEDPFYTAVGSRVFFLVHDNGTYELWATDGSPLGTGRIAELKPVEGFASRVEMAAYGGGVIAVLRSSDTTVLWRSDGTPAGTVRFRDLPYDNSLGSAEPTAAAGLLFFTSSERDHGAEVWRTDGTPEGTALVADVLPGPSSSEPAGLTAFGGRLYFAADDGVHGRELWQSDGTAAGTHLAQDIAPGLSGSYPDQLTVAGDRLYFTADDGLHGNELWALPLPGSAADCAPSPDHLCLQGARFRIEADWRDFQGNSGTGTAVALTPDTGYFWFFNPANVEVVTKVLDGRGVNQAFWVFYGALSSVEYALTVTDTQTGLSRRYENPAGELASVGDTHGFGPLGAFDVQKESERPRAARSLTLVSARTDPRAATGTCAAGPGRLCLNGGRFAVTAHWKDFQGHTGDGTAVPLTGDTGYFWFFNPTNVEVVAKVIDGRAVNDKFWLFYGALSSVEYTLTVADTQTGAVKMYTNASGNLASVADTGAF